MSTIRFELSKKKDKTNKRQILVRISTSREFRVGGKTKIFISSKDWDHKQNTVRRTSKIENLEKQKEVEGIRKQLNNLQEHIANMIIETTDLEKMKTKEERQDWIDYVIACFYDPCVKLVREKNLTFDAFAKVYVQQRSKEEHWKPAIRSHVNAKKAWDNPCFDKLSAVQTQLHKRAPRLLMDNITGKTLDEYQVFLIGEGFLNSTIRNHMCYIKQILKWANERGYLRHGDEVLKHETPNLEEVKPKAVNFLTWDEVEKMYNYKFEEGEEHLEETRDRFIFQCLTSLRHSDLQILKKADFDDFDNPTSFSFVSQKSHDSLTIYLCPKSRAIYDKYKDFPIEDGLLFPPKSNQKMNENLKVIAKRLGFTREITKMQYCGKTRVPATKRLCDVIGTHTARRSFVVHALEQGIPVQVVMSMTGHEDYETMRPYIAITDKKKKEMMESSCL